MTEEMRYTVDEEANQQYSRWSGKIPKLSIVRAWLRDSLGFDSATTADAKQAVKIIRRQWKSGRSGNPRGHMRILKSIPTKVRNKSRNPVNVTLPGGKRVKAQSVVFSGNGAKVVVLDEHLKPKRRKKTNPKKRTTSHRAMMHRAMMLASAKRSLAQYRADPQHHMLPSEFRRHLVSQYGSGIVNKIWRKSKANPKKRAATKRRATALKNPRKRRTRR